MIKTLDQMMPGECGKVSKVGGDLLMKRRIIDMGLVGGTNLSVIKYAPLGDPIEVKVKNFNLALRKAEAALIEVQAEA